MAFHRNAPTVLNRAYGDFEFWDGSAGRSLEQLVSGVLQFVNLDAQVPAWERLRTIPGYREEFQRAFGRGPDEAAMVQALATYCRTLLAGDSPEDRFLAGDKSALSTPARQGRTLFFGRRAVPAAMPARTSPTSSFTTSASGRRTRRSAFIHRA